MTTLAQSIVSILQYVGGYFTVPTTATAKSVNTLVQSTSKEPTSKIRAALPSDIVSWKHSLRLDATRCIEIWDTLRPVFLEHGFSLWELKTTRAFPIQRIGSMPFPNGYFYHNHYSLLSTGQKPEWDPAHGAHSAARGARGDDYVISVVAIGDRDEKAFNHLRILRRLSASYPDILLSNNHILPLVKEIFYGDIIFAVFPMLQGVSLYRCFLPNMPQRSVEDAVYLLLQALEATTYIHAQRIAHRDLFLENFLVEWIPESLTHPTAMRPRVYLIDFETAVQFEDDIAPEAMRLDTNDLPFPEEIYSREPAPELYLEGDYCPFKLDIWQLGHDLTKCFTSTAIPEIDLLWPTLVVDSPTDRPTAAEVLETLWKFVNMTPPQRLQIPFDYVMEPCA